MQDIAALAFAIDSSQAVTATAELDRLTRGAGSTQAAFRQMAEVSNDSSKALRDLASQAQLTDSMLRQAGTGLEALIGRIQTLSREVGTFRTTTQELTTALGQLRAAGDLFGTTASGIDEFVRSSRQIGLNSYETVSALQRITQALEGTSVAGERARRVLREYGVNVDGRSPDDGAAVLREFVQAMRGRRADGLRNDEVFSVLGPQSISSLAALNSDNYVTTEQRARRAQEGVISPLTLRVRSATAERDVTLRNQIAEREDLERNYGDFWEDAAPGWLGGGPDRPSILRQRRASGAPANGNAFRMEVQPDGTIRWNQGTWGQAFRGALRNQLGIGSQVRGMDQINEELDAYRNSDLYGAAQSDILLRFQEEDEARRDTGWWNRNFGFGPEARYYWNRFQAYRGQYAPRTDMRRQPDLQRTVNWDLDSQTMVAQGGMTDVQQQLQRMMIPALQGFGNINVDGFERMTPSQIMDRLRSNDQGWASEALQRRMEAMDSRAFQQEGRAIVDRDMTRRITSGAGARSDLFGLDPARLGIDGTDVLTDQEAQERAQLIAQAVLRIRQQFIGLDNQRRALEAAADEIDRDQRARMQRREATAGRDLDFMLGQRERAVDVNPQNRLQNIYDSTRERALMQGDSELLANTRALIALTEATTSLERSTNEALRNSSLGVARATNAANRWLTDEGYVFQQGTSLQAAQAVQTQARAQYAASIPPAPPTPTGSSTAPATSSLNFRELLPDLPPPGATLGQITNWVMAANAARGRARAELSDDDFAAFNQELARRQAQIRGMSAGTGFRNVLGSRAEDMSPAEVAELNRGINARLRPQPATAADGAIAIPELNVQAGRPAGAPAPELDPRADVRTGRLGAFISPVGRDLNWIRDRLYGGRSFDFDASAQVDRLISSGQVLSGNEDRLMSDARSEARRQYLERYDQALLRTIESYEQQREVLAASTPLERALNEARQRQARELTELTARLRGASPEEATAIRSRISLLGSSDRVGLYEDIALAGSRDRLRDNLNSQQRALDGRREDSAPWWYTSDNREAYANRSRAMRTAREAGGTDEDIARAAGLADRGSDMQRMLRETEQLRQAFVGMGQAGAQALEALILRGGNAREIFAQLAAQVASTFFRQATGRFGEQAFEWLGGNLFGGGSSRSAAAAGDGSSSSAGSGGMWSFFRSILPFAQGGISDASGSVVEHATMFPLPNGGRAQLGEAGDGDAVLPLRRMSNGSLGVASSGGGGKGDVYVTVTNHGAAAQWSPEQGRQISKEVRRAIEEQQTEQMLKEQRVGGMLNPI